MQTLFASLPLSFFSDLGQQFYDDFILKDRYMYIVQGFGNTVAITLVAVIIGIILGTLVALVRITHQNNPKKLRILNKICGLYLTVIRGTPGVVKLMIIYFVVFASSSMNPMVSAMLAFGLNSGAYVAEIVRGGIMAVDNGQFGAGRALGFNYFATMRHIILPQAFKNILPALGNEFIVLLKETSVAGYIGVADLTKGGDIITSNTYNAFLPLIAVALIYLVMVLGLQALVGKLERRLRKSDH